MEDNNINLAEMNEIFNNKTMRYRVNGFAHACNMHDIEITGNTKVLSSDKYFVALNVIRDKREKSVTLSGDYEDLHFSFINYYDVEKDNSQLDRKIIDLPFSILLIKTVDQDTYKLDIETTTGREAVFKLTKSCEFKNRTLYNDVTFKAVVMDFSEILKLIKSFVFNPVYVFNTYNELQEKYHAIYTNSDFKQAILQDEKLDKPMTKIQKLMKRLSNSD